MYPTPQPHPHELDRVFQLLVAPHDPAPIPLPSSNDIPGVSGGAWLRGKLVMKTKRA